ncbi:MAG: NmrA family NAD(P)-binding protein [Elusimicrobia bacterium]|nr:NmrA family NAD(P)-binding protein [Candidatus Obscuribacterium magneticum]
MTMQPDHLYVITGATGQIGRKLVRHLLQEGQKVRAIGRDPNKLKPLSDLGAEPFLGNLEDVSAITQAFSGAQAVFTMIPPNTAVENLRAYQSKVSEVYTAALKTTRVPYVLNLSSVGAHLKESAGLISGLHDNEERLNNLEGLNVLHLRPCFFMENLFSFIDLINQRGVIGSPLDGNIFLPMIATADIADVAADLLLKLAFTGKSVRELLGHRDVTMNQLAALIEKEIKNKSLHYVQWPPAQVEAGLIQNGMSQDVARLMVEMQVGMNKGIIKPNENRSPQNTTPTSLEEFIRTVFLPTYHLSQPPAPVAA